ncbi:MAG: STAS/SEC14 domain-containing protein [Motiliproteus sp.]|nr:STAS/SEC14 domain-containing protein [Motiliproteus sp.]MCW9051935.1 STAS/SEC14 domain-containing protein [Motiliproteus sp.]
MAISWNRGEDGIVEVTVSGKMGVEEFRALQQDGQSPLTSQTGLKILIIADGFEGWQSGDWEETGFDEQVDQNITAMAVMMEPRWHDQASLFMAKDLRPIAIEFFTPDRQALARRWLLDR